MKLFDANATALGGFLLWRNPFPMTVPCGEQSCKRSAAVLVDIGGPGWDGEPVGMLGVPETEPLPPTLTLAPIWPGPVGGGAPPTPGPGMWIPWTRF